LSNAGEIAAETGGGQPFLDQSNPTTTPRQALMPLVCLSRRLPRMMEQLLSSMLESSSRVKFG
jgi:hypothetical protein